MKFSIEIDFRTFFILWIKMISALFDRLIVSWRKRFSDFQIQSISNSIRCHSVCLSNLHLFPCPVSNIARAQQHETKNIFPFPTCLPHWALDIDHFQFHAIYSKNHYHSMSMRTILLWLRFFFSFFFIVVHFLLCNVRIAVWFSPNVFRIDKNDKQKICVHRTQCNRSAQILNQWKFSLLTIKCERKQWYHGEQRGSYRFLLLLLLLLHNSLSINRIVRCGHERKIIASWLMAYEEACSIQM